MLESWNRNVGRTYHLGEVDPDPLPHTQVGIGPDGTVSAAGEPVTSRHLVVNEYASRIELPGERLTTSAAGLTLYRTQACSVSAPSRRASMPTAGPGAS